MKLIIKSLLCAACLLGLAGCDQQEQASVTIGIVEPLEHKAMDEIVAGFSETLHKLYSKPVVIKIENAQNDANLERAIIQKMRDSHYTMIIPIGVGATQMTLSMVRDKPVVSLASDVSNQDRKKLVNNQVAVVHDEISPKQLLTFIHAVYPKLTQLTLVHSATDKVFPEVDATIAAGKALGITIDHRMVSSLPELSSVMQSLPATTQAIFILKDNLIVSGIGTLAKEAEKRHIPLITSDQGSVQEGAAFSLGVHEKEIGIEGAKLAVAILNGKNASTLPIVDMLNLTVFINPAAHDIDLIRQAAATLHYQIEMAS